MAPKVRQMRGPGMNKGLKKPRFGKFSSAEPKPYKPAKGASRSESTAGEAASSYLSSTLLKGMEGPRSRRGPKSSK